jgi:hypothetical protein
MSKTSGAIAPPFNIGDRVVFLVNSTGLPLWTFTSHSKGVSPERSHDYHSSGAAQRFLGNRLVEATVMDIDNDETYRVEWNESPIVGAVEWWFCFEEPDPALPMAEGWPRLAGESKKISASITPDHTQSVSVGKHQQVPDRIVAEMTARGENHPRRTLTRWPYQKRWVADAGVRREGAGECGQDLFTISWRWEEIPQRD